MKKIMGIIFISLLVHTSVLFAQVCAGMSAEAFPMTPQTGSYNYFGVRVTLDQTYSQDVTVTGYIYTAGSPNQNNPYTLTITAGNLTEETGAGFFATGPADDAAVDISSVTPCPSDFAIPYDSIGIYHNIGISNCKSSESPISCAVSYGESLFPYVFDQETISDIVDQAAYAALHDSTNYVPEYLSSGGRDYSSQIISMVDGIEGSNQIEQTIDNISELESEISESNLSAFEKQVLLYAGSIARHSLNFWLQNTDSSESVAMLKYHNNNSFTIAEQLISGYEISNKEAALYNFATDFSLNNINFNGLIKPKWLRKLLHVVVGDIVGGLVGASFGTLAPGGPITIFVGGLFGAMSGSLAAADSEDML